MVYAHHSSSWEEKAGRSVVQGESQLQNELHELHETLFQKNLTNKKFKIKVLRINHENIVEATLYLKVHFFKKELLYLFYGYVLVPECIYVHYLYVGNHRVKKRVLGSLELESDAVQAAQFGCWALYPGFLQE